ncbi:putative acyl-CoA dehydrogenase [metagenome]|uniref:Putative acyl-CoA dehydrogenase n=1 Tax=metagenome TaxID=256318 RepID=A0A2P2C8N1_9ZZZZ
MISFELDGDQRALRDNVRRFLRARAPVRVARALMTTPLGFQPEVWKQLGAELGLQGVAVPERFGGSGAGAVELGVVMEELGRVLYPGPFLASAVFATNALLSSGDLAAMETYLPGLASGDLIGTLAVAEKSRQFLAADITLEARDAGSGWVLTGAKHFVVHGAVASLLLVAARTPSGISLFAVRGAAPGLVRDDRPVLDQTRALASLRFEATPATLVGDEGLAWPGIEHALDRSLIALAAETVGLADAVLELTVDYAKTRVQFDRPIGSFQAIKHKLADLVVEIELARSAVDYATRAIDTDGEGVRGPACIAIAQAAEAATHATGESIQIHGGVGMTWEHDAHLYFKRARANAALLGTIAAHRERLLQSIGV